MFSLFLFSELKIAHINIFVNKHILHSAPNPITPETQTALASLLRAGIMQKDIAEILGITHSANGIYRVKKAQKNYNWIYENRKDLVKYLKCKKGKYRVAN